MTNRLFREGGPHNIKSLGNDQHQMSITMPKDDEGRVARECPNSLCSPAYFKVTPGTGFTGEQDVVYCPYCKHEAEPSDFTTQEQIRYAKGIALREAQGGIDDMIKDALGLGASGKRKIGGGFISMEMTYKPSTPRHVRRPYEDEVRRDVVCPHCTPTQITRGDGADARGLRTARRQRIGAASEAGQIQLDSRIPDLTPTEKVVKCPVVITRRSAVGIRIWIIVLGVGIGVGVCSEMETVTQRGDEADLGAG